MTSIDLFAATDWIPSESWIGCIEATVGGIFLPVFLVIIYYFIYNYRNPPEDNDEEIKKSTPLKLSRFVLNRSIVIVCISVPITVLMCVNQLAYTKSNISFDADINYYIRTKASQYDNFQVVTTAQTDTSYRSLVGHNSYQSRRLEGRSLSSLLSTQLIIVYHTSDWSDMFTTSNLLNVCTTEKNIISTVSCLDFSSITTAIPTLVSYSDCSAVIGSYESFSSDEAASYFQDNISPTNPQSTIIMSYVLTGSCNVKDANSLYDDLNSAASSGIEVSFVNQDFLDYQLYSSFENAAYYMIIAIIFATIILAIWIRGIVCSLTAVFCVSVSVIIATSVLPLFGYQYFSIINGLALFFNYGIGVSTVFMFHSSWRRTIKIGYPATPDSFLESYNAIARPMVYVFCIACLVYFINYTSPIIIMNQLGVFMGISIAVFFVEFHIVFMPVWIIMSSITFLQPEAHDEIDILVRKISCNLLFWNHDDETIGEVAPVVVPDAPPSADVHSVSVLQTIDDDVDCEDDDNQFGTVVDSSVTTGYLRSSRDEADDSSIPPPPSSVSSSPRTGHFTFSNADIMLSPSSNQSGRNSTQRRNSNTSSIDESSPRLYSHSLTDSTTSALSRPRSRNSSFIDGNNTPSPRPHSLSIAESVADPVYPTLQSEAESATGSPRGTIPTTESPRAAPVLHLDNDSIELDSAGNPFYRSKAKSRDVGLVFCYRSIMVTFGICSFVGIFFYFNYQYSIGAGIPQLVPDSINLGQSLKIISDYKASLLTLSYPVVPFAPTTHPTTMTPTYYPSTKPSALSTSGPTTYPSDKPTAFSTANPSSVPSLSPTTTFSPTPNFPLSYLPTAIPSRSTPRPTSATTRRPSGTPSFRPTLSPRASPTIRPTNIPTDLSTESADIITLSKLYYTVSCCYGIDSSSSSKIDSQVTAIYDESTFNTYISNGFLADINQVCNYVDANRDYLNINPSWDRSRDCLYEQLIDAENSSLFISQYSSSSEIETADVLLFWASQSSQSSPLLGVIPSSSSSSSLLYKPLWICMNFSLVSNVTNLYDDSSLASNLMNRWDNVFTQVSPNASMSGIALKISSSDFATAQSYQLIHESIFVIEIAILGGVVGLLLLITWDIRLFLVTLCIMSFIFLGAVTVYEYTFITTVDTIDEIILVTTISFVIYFPIYFILDYKHEKELGIASASRRFGLSVSPTISSSSFYMRHTLLGPLIMTIVLCIPLLVTEQYFTNKLAHFLIIVISLSYLVTVFLFPPLIALAAGFNGFVKFIKWIGLENEEWYRTEQSGDNNPSRLNSQSLMPLRQASINNRNNLAIGRNEYGTVRLNDVPSHSRPSDSPRPEPSPRQERRTSPRSSTSSPRSNTPRRSVEVTEVETRFNEFTLATPRSQRRSENLRQFLIHDDSDDDRGNQRTTISVSNTNSHNNSNLNVHVQDFTLREDSWRNRDEIDEERRSVHSTSSPRTVDSTTTDTIPFSSFNIITAPASFAHMTVSNSEVASSRRLRETDNDMPESRPVIHRELSLTHPDRLNTKTTESKLHRSSELDENSIAPTLLPKSVSRNAIVVPATTAESIGTSSDTIESQTPNDEETPRTRRERRHRRKSRKDKREIYAPITVPRGFELHADSSEAATSIADDDSNWLDYTASSFTQAAAQASTVAAQASSVAAQASTAASEWLSSAAASFQSTSNIFTYLEPNDMFREEEKVTDDLSSNIDGTRRSGYRRAAANSYEVVGDDGDMIDNQNQNL